MKAVLALAVFCLATRSFSQPADCDSMDKCQEALKANGRSSLIHYRIAEFYFAENNYQSSANEFREALNGDLVPKWIEVWAHVNLGKIFDLTGQRERALNEYRLAQRTGDNTRGALDEAAKYTKDPYKKPD
jgi:tetratricopeptide (TPR) repeat protein